MYLEMEELAAANALHFGFSTDVPATARNECDAVLRQRRTRRIQIALAAASAEMYVPGEPRRKACRYVKTKLTFSLSDADALRYTSVVLSICGLARPVDWTHCTRQQATLWTGQKFVERQGYTVAENTSPDREVILNMLRKTVPVELMNELDSFHTAWSGYHGFPVYYTATDLLIEFVTPSVWRFMNIVVSEGNTVSRQHMGSLLAWIGIPREQWLPEHTRALFRATPGYHVDYWTLKDTADGRAFHTEMVKNWESHIYRLCNQGLSSVCNFLVPLYVDWMYVTGGDFTRIIPALRDIAVRVLSVVSHEDSTAFEEAGLKLPAVWPPPARLRTVRYLLDVLPTQERESLLTDSRLSLPLQALMLDCVADSLVEH